MDWISWALIVAGVWNVFWGLVTEATGDNQFISTIFFKVAPFFIGLACLVGFFSKMGWVNF